MTCDVLSEPLEPASDDPGILTRRQLVLSSRPLKARQKPAGPLGMDITTHKVAQEIKLKLVLLAPKAFHPRSAVQSLLREHWM